MSDLHGTLPRVEEVLRQLQQNTKAGKGFVKGSGGRAGKTVMHYANGLSAFVSWLYHREYLDVDPLRAMGKFDTTTKTTRRALTAGEIRRLLEATEATCYGRRRRLGYELALASGLRANEPRTKCSVRYGSSSGSFELVKDRRGKVYRLPVLVLRVPERGQKNEQAEFRVRDR